MTRTMVILLLSTVGVYLLLSVMLGIAALTGREELKKRIAHGVWLGVIFHTALIVIHIVDIGHFPIFGMHETLILFSWLLAVVYAVMQTLQRNYSLGMFVAPLVALALSVSFFSTDKAASFVATTSTNRWLYMHVAFGFSSFAFFTLAFVAACGYFLQEYTLKSRRGRPMRLKLPPLEWLDNTSYRLVSMGLPLLTIGIVTGAICSKSFNGVFWLWESKQVALVTLWLVYAVYLHIRAIRGLRGRGTNMVLLCGFVILIVNFFLVSFFA